jgi:predicted amidohydrolase
VPLIIIINFTEFFPKYAELIPSGQTSSALSEAAREHKVYLVAGSIPEKDGEKLYNTCTVWNPSGELVTKHQKVSSSSSSSVSWM